MSGWDASRPARDPQRHESGTGPRHAGGAPPDIFEREYGAQAYAQQPYGQPDGRADYSQPEHGQPEHGQPEHGQPDYGSGEFPPRHWAGHGDTDRQANGSGSRPGPAQDDYPGQDYNPWQPDQYGFGQQDFARQDYGRPGGLPGFGQLDREQQSRNGQPGHREPEYAGRDYVGRDTLGRDTLGGDTLGGDTADPTYAARMDPALQDFFKPLPPAPGFTPSGPQPRPPGQPAQSRQQGQPGQPAQSRQQGQPGQSRQPGQPFPPTQSHRPFRPELDHGAPTAATPWDAEEGGLGRANGTDRWDTDAPRPGSRSARRQDRQPPRRGRAIAGVAIGVVVVVGVAAVAYKVLDKKNTGTPAANSTPPAVSPSQRQSSPAASHPSSGSQSTGYTLSAPASAGGYSKLATAPSPVKSVATATSQSLRQRAVSAGGKVTGQVTGYYQLSSGQVMSFAGYEGAFDPGKVLAALGSKWSAFPAGSHGGDLACTPSAGTPGGTVCAWVTTTTFGVTEFFGSTGSPEIVTEQPKAAQDTENVRADVEAAKS